MAKVSGIYVILNTKNGKVYIGQAQDINDRWKEHKNDLGKNKHKNKHLQAAWNKYGAKVFEFLKLEYCDVARLTEREQHHIDIYRAKGICYNIVVDVRAPMRGRTHSDETRRKMSEALRGKIVSAETRSKMSESRKNHIISDETRRKMSEAKKNISDETRRKLSEANKNRPPISEETRHKMGEASRNRSEETRRKISEAATLRHARRRAEREAAVNGLTEGGEA